MAAGEIIGKGLSLLDRLFGWLRRRELDKKDQLLSDAQKAINHANETGDTSELENVRDRAPRR